MYFVVTTFDSIGWGKRKAYSAYTQNKHREESQERTIHSTKNLIKIDPKPLIRDKPQNVLVKGSAYNQIPNI